MKKSGRSGLFSANQYSKFAKTLEFAAPNLGLEGIKWKFLAIHDEAFKLNVDFARIEHHVRRRWILFEV